MKNYGLTCKQWERMFRDCTNNEENQRKALAELQRMSKKERSKLVRNFNRGEKVKVELI